MKKLWRSIFFAMWLADLPKVHDELARSVAKTVHRFGENDAVRRWTLCFCATLAAEWARLDKYRLDKYYLLARHFVRESLAWCAKKDWAPASVDAFASAIDAGWFAAPKCPDGPRLHYGDVLLEARRVRGSPICSTPLLPAAVKCTGARLGTGGDARARPPRGAARRRRGDAAPRAPRAGRRPRRGGRRGDAIIKARGALRGREEAVRRDGRPVRACCCAGGPAGTTEEADQAPRALEKESSQSRAAEEALRRIPEEEVAPHIKLTKLPTSMQ